MTWKRYWNPEEMLEAGDGSPVAAHHPRIPRTAVILRYILYEHRNGKDRAGRHENCRQDERIFVTHSNGGEGDGHRRGSQFITGVALTAVNATPVINWDPRRCPSPSPPLLCVTKILSSCLQFSCRPARSLPFRCS